MSGNAVTASTRHLAVVPDARVEAARHRTATAHAAWRRAMEFALLLDEDDDLDDGELSDLIQAAVELRRARGLLRVAGRRG